MDSSSGDEENLQGQDDAYAEDDLPDLVLDATLGTGHNKDSNSSSLDQVNNEGSTSSSVIDLLLSMTKGRRSVSSSDIAHWFDVGEDEIDNFDREEVSKYSSKNPKNSMLSNLKSMLLNIN